ncbi:MAG TPA: slipin family protein [Fimbriimonadaceae bacterium]|nr:slipin family protein [Fimbriimonadaceae bacterium]
MFVAGALSLIALVILKNLRFEVRVAEGSRALLFRYGKFVRQLEPGRFVAYGNGYTSRSVDMRAQSFAIGNQEIVTAEGIPVRLSAIVRFQPVDALAYSLSAYNANDELYLTVQIALRELIVGKSTEDLLAQRVEIGEGALDRLSDKVAEFGIKVLDVAIRDIVLGGELKRAMASKLQAHLEAQASLERARGEAATLRSLANTATAMQKNPALAQIRLLQAIESGKATVVVGDASLAALGK